MACIFLRNFTLRVLLPSLYPKALRDERKSGSPCWTQLCVLVATALYLCPKNRHTNNKTWTIIPTLNPNLGGSLRVYVHPWNLLVQYFFISFSVPCSRYLNSRKCTLLKGTEPQIIAPTGKTPTPRSTPSCIFIQDPSRRRGTWTE